jgi:hypothetical protein
MLDELDETADEILEINELDDDDFNATLLETVLELRLLVRWVDDVLAGFVEDGLKLLDELWSIATLEDNLLDTNSDDVLELRFI